MKYVYLTPLLFLFLLPIDALFSENEIILDVAENQNIIQVDKPVLYDDSNYIEFVEAIPSFTFSTFEIEQHEGCTDSLVYPGGFSGPTISCGLDLGNFGKSNLIEVLKYKVPDSIFNILIKASSIRGENSISWIRKNQVHLGDKTALIICNSLKVHIWRQVRARYPNLEDAPNEVKTAMLDIAFQAGVGSKRMNGFGTVIARKDWNTLGQMIEVSYSDFEGGNLHSIHQRRETHGKQIQFMYNPPEKIINYD